MIGYIYIQRFYVRELGLEHDPMPAVVLKNKKILDINLAAETRRVHAQMSSRDAKACLMGGTFREWHHDSYVNAARAWLDRVAEFSDTIEIDAQHSAWIDLSRHPDPVSTYRSLLDSIDHARGGLAKNKWLAKLAATHGDPVFDAVFDPRRFMADIPVEAVSAIQGAHAERLSFLGYRTCGDAAKIALETLLRQFGEEGLAIHSALRGEGGERVKAQYPERSIGDRFVFPEPIDDIQIIDRTLTKLAHRVGRHLKRLDAFGSRISLTLLMEDASTLLDQRTFTRPISDPRSVYFAMKRLFDSLDNKQPVQEIRIRLFELEHKSPHQQSFDQLLMREKLSRADSALKCVRKSFGEDSVKLGKDLVVPRRLRVLKEWRDATGWV